jgi:hypothetical protein
MSRKTIAQAMNQAAQRNLTFNIDFPNSDRSVIAVWNERTRRLELDHGYPDILPQMGEGRLAAIKRSYPDAEVSEIL